MLLLFSFQVFYGWELLTVARPPGFSSHIVSLLCDVMETLHGITIITNGDSLEFYGCSIFQKAFMDRVIQNIPRSIGEDQLMKYPFHIEAPEQ